MQAQIQFRSLQIDHGLSQNSVTSITQDQSGNLWFATQDGLNKYNGEFDVFDFQFDDITMTSHYTLGKLYADHLNRIWLIKKFGRVGYQDGNQFVEVTNFGNASAFGQDHKNNYWVGNKQGMVFKANEKMDEVDSILIGHKSIYNLQAHPNEGVLIAHDNGLQHISDDFTTNVIYKGSAISDVFVKGDNIYFSVFGNEVFVMSPCDKEARKLAIKLNDQAIVYSILLDQNDQLWIGTYGHGLYLYDMNTKLTDHYQPVKSNPYSFSYHDVLDIFEDDKGTIWFGTDGGGVAYYDQYLQKFHLASNITLPEDVNVDVVRAIYTDDNFMSLGLSGKGLTRFNKKNNQWSSLQRMDGLFSERIMALQGDEKDGLWVGSQFNGLAYLRFSETKIEKQQVFLDSTTIWSITGDMKPFLYLGSGSKGLVKFNTQDFSFSQLYPGDEIKDGFSVRSVWLSNSNYLIIGTDAHGVFHYDINNDAWKKIGDDILPEKIKQVYAIKDSLFVASNGLGLYVWNISTNSLLAHYDKTSGLPNNVIYSVLPVDNNEVWLSSNRGLSFLDLTNIHEPNIKNFGLSVGLQSLEFNTGAHFLDKKGNMYFGGINGLNWFHPKHIPINPYPPNTTLLSVIVKDQVYEYTKDVIDLPYHKNSINFHVTSMAHTLPKETEFNYRLAGFDEEWKTTSNTRFEYMNIPPGDYVFECKSKNYDGIESDEVLRQSIRIKKAWYLTNGFKLCMLGIIGYLLWRIRKSEMHAIRLRSEKQINQLEISRLEKSALQAQMNPHFIFNCLNSIQSFIILNDKENAMEYLSKFAKLIRQSLNASAEKKISLHDELSMLRNYLDLEKLRFNDKFEYSIILASNVIPKELNIPPLLIQPYVENAIIHGISGKEKGGKIDLSFIKVSPHQLQVKISDNGIGYKVPTKKTEHRSLGMSITSKRLAYNNNLNNSDIEIRPNYSNEGTVVAITITL